MPLGEWLDRWLEEYAAPSVRPSTLEGYRDMSSGISSTAWGTNRWERSLSRISGSCTGTPGARPPGGAPAIRVQVGRFHCPPHPRRPPRGPGCGSTGKPDRQEPHRRHHPAKEKGRAQAGPEQCPAGAVHDSHPGGQSLARLLLHGADYRPASGRDLRPHVAGLRRGSRHPHRPPDHPCGTGRKADRWRDKDRGREANHHPAAQHGPASIGAQETLLYRVDLP